ncbi:peptidylprolyl isomerase [Clostridium gasigenes]|uniref:peptidylprolyl isomerase n=1 Tax=Clostridium gasigenes TaxID=94869 RepID=UPI0016264DCD|nr:peptidylprolyl isomerase [Clostridium gasigenes]MBB6622860.1 peptidylprolyl isomerase [Clostridium gasigenes]MBU3108443.1 peptidylprolyl isomerase [Clostridium gasigenes]
MKKKSLSKYLKLIILAVAMSSLVLVGCGANKKNESASNGSSNNEVVENKGTTDETLPVATIVIKGMGTIKAELYPSVAPNTVNNFIELANKDFYNGLIFHRVIENFMIQGGDPKGNGQGDPGYAIKGEFSGNGFENNLKHTKGVLSMARAKSADSAGSQFFIMTEDNESLDGEYAAFGKVIEGLDVVDAIKVVKTGANDKPKEDVIIESITVDTKGKTYSEAEKIAK